MQKYKSVLQESGLSDLLGVVVAVILKLGLLLLRLTVLSCDEG